MVGVELVRKRPGDWELYDINDDDDGQLLTDDLGLVPARTAAS